jgi:hypothetical protein
MNTKPADEPLVVTSAESKREPQAPVAVTVTNTGVAGQSIAELAGKAAITRCVILYINCLWSCRWITTWISSGQVSGATNTFSTWTTNGYICEVNVKQNHQASVAVATAILGNSINRCFRIAGRRQSLEPSYLYVNCLKLADLTIRIQ